MNVGSLFSGIGGLDLGLERAGMTIRWQVEIDEWCRRVLAKHWPNVKRYGDIRTIRGDELEPVDLICGGFPCQPHSLAGKRLGSEDDRDLWGEFIRIVRAVRPRWVLAENVPGLLSSESGRFFGRVLGDLAESGYDAEWDCIPAAAVGAPHIRDRVFIIAWNVADSKCARLQGGTGAGLFRPSKPAALCEGTGRRWETESRLGGVFDGTADWLDRHRWPAPRGCKQYEWEPPRLAYGRIPYRRQRLAAVGNAVVPQVAEFIGRRIMEVSA